MECHRDLQSPGSKTVVAEQVLSLTLGKNSACRAQTDWARIMMKTRTSQVTNKINIKIIIPRMAWWSSLIFEGDLFRIKEVRIAASLCAVCSSNINKLASFQGMTHKYFYGCRLILLSVLRVAGYIAFSLYKLYILPRRYLASFQGMIY